MLRACNFDNSLLAAIRRSLRDFYSRDFYFEDYFIPSIINMFLRIFKKKSSHQISFTYFTLMILSKINYDVAVTFMRFVYGRKDYYYYCYSIILES